MKKGCSPPAPPPQVGQEEGLVLVFLKKVSRVDAVTLHLAVKGWAMNAKQLCGFLLVFRSLFSSFSGSTLVKLLKMELLPFLKGEEFKKTIT